MDIILVFICFIKGLEANYAITDANYERVSDMALVSLNESLQTTSLIQCAMECLATNMTCSSFSYNTITELCVLGSCVKTFNYTQDDSVSVFTSAPRCQDVTGFKIVTYGSRSACVWFSNVTKMYHNASRDCQAKGASLYTVRYVEKLYILTALSDQYWIGLEYFVSEKIYRWADDGSVFHRTSYWGEIFGPNEPNAPGSENCIHYYQLGIKKLNDRACTALFKYICEVPCFKL